MRLAVVSLIVVEELRQVVYMDPITPGSLTYHVTGIMSCHIAAYLLSHRKVNENIQNHNNKNQGLAKMPVSPHSAHAFSDCP